MKKIISNYLLFVVIIHFNVQSQTTDDQRILIEDNWIEKMSNKIAVGVSVNNWYNTFLLQDPTAKFIITPNIPANIKLNLNYDFISLGFQFKTPEKDKELKGSSKSYKLGAVLIFKHLYTDLSYSSIEGYYLENTSDYIPNWKDSDPYVQFPDLHYNSLSLSAGYSFNSRFSLKSLLSQTERQLKSAGSFIPVFNIDYYIADDRSTNLEFKPEKSSSIEVSIGPGYTYNFVVKEKLYLSLGLSASVGSLYTETITRLPGQNIESNDSNPIFRSNTKIGFGFNGHKFYSGAYSNIAASRVDSSDGSYTNTNFFFQIFFGIRFNSPDYLKRFVTKIKSTRLIVN